MQHTPPTDQDVIELLDKEYEDICRKIWGFVPTKWDRAWVKNHDHFMAEADERLRKGFVRIH